MNTKKCGTCKIEKPLSDFSRNRSRTDGVQGSCRICGQYYHRKWKKENPEKFKLSTKAWEERKIKENPNFLLLHRRKHNCRKYNLTVDGFDKILESQNGLCAICQNGTIFGFGKGKWQIDHDHKCCPQYRGCCGKCIRGILCSGCNTGLGLFQDSIFKLFNAIFYLGRQNGIGTVS